MRSMPAWAISFGPFAKVVQFSRTRLLWPMAWSISDPIIPRFYTPFTCQKRPINIYRPLVTFIRDRGVGGDRRGVVGKFLKKDSLSIDWGGFAASTSPKHPVPARGNEAAIKKAK